MEQYLILEFQNRQAAEYCLAMIDNMASDFWVAEGYLVIDGELVGKNAATGQDMPGATRTLSWDVVRESPEGTFYFSSLRNDTRVTAGADRLPAEVFGFIERVFPEAWIVQS